MSLRAGDLKERVTLLKRSLSADPAWGPQETFTPSDEFWAAVVPVAASERVQSGGIQTVASHRIGCRWRDDVTSKDRLQWNGTTLEILSVIDPDRRRVELVIEAREYPAEGGAA